MSLRRLLPALLLAIPGALGAQAAAPAPERPSLVVFITVDQLRTDYLDRWRGQLTGGLGRLTREGAFYTNAFHDHATTETAPGHASTLSGRFPRSTGIVRNNAGVYDERAPLVTGRGAGASPFRFRGTTLIDWMRTRDPRSRALSVSRKDRGAILPLGRAHEDVYWYVGDVGFTTSRYYADTLPSWVQRFNARRANRRWTGQPWTTLLPEKEYAEEDTVVAENGGHDIFFPHPSPADSVQAAAVLGNYPWMDQHTADMALEGVRALDLGRGPATDLLAVSFSTLDAVGHRFGPDSREVHDMVVRLDRIVGGFLDSLFKLRDPSRVVIALTADHGVAPIPEVHFRGQRQATLRADLNAVVARTMQQVASAGAGPAAFDFEYGMVVLDRPALQRARIDADSLVRTFLDAARKVPGVMRVDTRDALQRADTVKDAIARRWLHSLPDDLPVAATVTLHPYVYWQPESASWATGATHGSPHDYDAQVPVLFWGRPFAAGRHAQFARVVDMAPTLAHVLGIPPTERLDGHVLTSGLRAR